MTMKYIIVSLFLVIISLGCNTSSKKHGPTEEEIKLLALEKGNLIADETQSVLASNLKRVIQRDGISQTIKYCDVKAYPIVDSLKKVYKADIRRVSLRTRNPDNSPDQQEENIIHQYIDNINNGETPSPLAILDIENVHFYKPIILNAALCLNCHGEIGIDIKEDNYEIIKALYTSDNATGYKMGDLRGVWSITFKRDIFEKQ
jgi:hypothetical protein